MEVTLIDFEDSFTYNLVQALEEVGFRVRVLAWRDFDSLPLQGALVLGPGPGHPDDYQSIFSLVHAWLIQSRPFCGICLGHQIYWRLQGKEVTRSKHPLHGQKIKLQLDKEWRVWLGVKEEVFVQRYNSLAVIASVLDQPLQIHNFNQDEEVLMSRGKRLITYQFHPESVGTSYRKRFMSKVYSILTE
jgi:anthranilate/para-aminobenzoate synthase component II